MSYVVWISIIGAGSVFISLTFLWFLMYLLVHLTSTRTNKKSKDSSGTAEPNHDLECKQKAAAASAAVAIVLMNTSFIATHHKMDKEMSAWQLAHRNLQQNNQLGSIFKNRKKS